MKNKDIYLSCNGLTKSYNDHGLVTKALDSVDLVVQSGEVLGLIGESGSGKSTLSRILLGLESPDSGEVIIGGCRTDYNSPSCLRHMKKDNQIVFQDAANALDNMKKVGKILSETIRIHHKVSKAEAIQRSRKVILDVGLSTLALDKYPTEFSGGERQRINIAKALVVEPKFLICDEPVSALDISIQGKIINLLMKLKDEYHLTYLFIAHDMDIIRHVSDRVAVMNKGSIVKTSSCRPIKNLDEKNGLVITYT